MRAAGLWRLRVFDAELDGLTGSVVSWSVTLTSRPCVPGAGWQAVTSSVTHNSPGPRAGAAAAVSPSDGALYLWGGASDVTPLYGGELPLPPPFDAVWRFSATGAEGAWAWSRAGSLRPPASAAAATAMAGAAVATAALDSRRGPADGGGACAQNYGMRVCWLSDALHRWDAVSGAWLRLDAAAPAVRQLPHPPPSGTALALVREPDTGQLLVYAFGGGQAGASSGASSVLLAAHLPM